LLFILATVMWCQRLDQKVLTIYAASVTFTAILKYVWEKYV